MKYYLIGFFALLGVTGVLAIWQLADIRWFMTIAIVGVVMGFILAMTDVIKVYEGGNNGRD
jgi:hypothetical protein